MRVGGRGSHARSAKFLTSATKSLRVKGIVLVLLAGLVFVIGAAAQRYGYVREGIAQVRKLQNLPDQYRILSVQPERITIDIKHKHYLQLAHKREQALASGLLVSSSDDFVPATIRHGENSVPVKLRLKGDLKEHWNTDKWSFRIVTKGDETLFGMKQFSIQRPDARNFLYEWIYHKALAREGLIALRYDFLDVTVNGESLGIFALEEHFEKRLLEHNRRREGPIVRFNENLFWLEALDQGYLSGIPGPSGLSGTGSYLSSSIDGFQSNRWLSDEEKRPKYIEAVHLLEAFRRSELSASEVFDVPQLAMYLALSDMLRAAHAASWRNIRFYYNPITSRLEPIGFDGTQIQQAYRGIIPMINWRGFKSGLFYNLNLYTTMFADLELYQEYIRALDKISAPGYLEALFTDLESEIERKEFIIRRDNPEFRFSKKPLMEARRFIQSMLNPSAAINAHLASVSDGSLVLEVGNLNVFPVEIVEVIGAGGSVPVPSETILVGRNPDELVNYQIISFPGAAEDAGEVLQPSEIRIRYRLLGTERLLESGVFPYPARAEDISSSLTRSPANIANFSFIRIDETSARIIIEKGTWALSENLIVPAGYRLTAGEGTILELSNSASIVSRSPIDFRATEEDPIILRSVDGSGGGFLVLQADGQSILENVVFDGMSAPQDSGLAVSGAVTFFNSPVAIRNSHFLNAKAEDALNIVQSQFEISGGSFQNSASDAFDSDFSEGEIVQTRFVSSANDAIDVSGSAITVRNVTIQGTGDKAISAGENSRLAGVNITVDGASIAVASKDLSEVILDKLSISATDIGLAVFKKKPEFGPGSILAKGLKFDNVTDLYWVEEKSWLSVNGRIIPGTRSDPESIFYPSSE